MLGANVPLRQVATLSPDWTQGQITHRNGMRTLSVLADVKFSENFNAVFSKVREFTDVEISPNLPSGMKMEYGGNPEMEAEVMEPMSQGLLIAFVIIFMILLFHFCKLSRASLVMVSSLLSLFGAAFGVWILGIDFSTTAMLGIVGLIGIIVRNGIIMFDYIEKLRSEQNVPVREAAIEAGKRRMRPIFLTSAAASMGVLPMIISGSPMWCPLGTVIFFGTMISMVLVVTVLPVAYWLLFDKKSK
jgi:multidrug efflux pump subunit AcrB